MRRFLNEVQSYSSSNKMSVQNLATVFGPNIFRAKAEDPQSIVGGKQTQMNCPELLSLTKMCKNKSFFLKGRLFAYSQGTVVVH